MIAFVPSVQPRFVHVTAKPLECTRRIDTVNPSRVEFLRRQRPVCAMHVGDNKAEQKLEEVTSSVPWTEDASDVSFAFAWFTAACSALGAPSAVVAAVAEAPSSLKSTLTSQPFNLAHPTVMWLLFFTSVYALNLGWQSRQIRSAEPEKRKELVKSKVTQRHFTTATTLFAIMTTSTFLGMGNTYLRTGKLFPGPHLYVGLSLVTLMAFMTALVPHMQQGKDWAKNTHLAAGLSVVGLFGWQAKSGMAIVAKLLHWE